jgi:hypothetical protein
MRAPKSDREARLSSFQEHVHGALAIGGLTGFYAHECHGRGIIEALARQNDYAIAGLAILSVATVIYLWSQAKSFWSH